MINNINTIDSFNITIEVVEDIYLVEPKPFHVYVWVKGLENIGQEYYKAYFFADDSQAPYSVGVQDNAWNAVKEALDNYFYYGEA